MQCVRHDQLRVADSVMAITPENVPPVFWKKGDKDPDAGKPHRHTRNKIQLILEDMESRTESYYDDCQMLESVLWVIAEKHPGEVLDALIQVNEGKWPW